MGGEGRKVLAFSMSVVLYEGDGFVELRILFCLLRDSLKNTGARGIGS